MTTTDQNTKERDIYHEILQKCWGYTEFRPMQEEIIRSVCAGKDTLGLMPTGGGKSITFQVPAMAMEGLCLVVTPLIALMKDQVDNLWQRGIKATYVNSTMSREQIITQLENCIFGNYKFLYVSPERLETEIFLSKLQAMDICLLVIDESHCISQWGYDFRPSYLSIANIRERLPDVPVLALTATATPEVAEDIQKRLLFKESNIFRTSFERENLNYVVRYTDNKLQTLLHILKKVPGTAIVYVRNRKNTKEIASFLQSQGIPADFYHAGLENLEKETRQNLWKTGQCRVIVATNAFGMGIDKPDVRLVVHISMPGSLEEYYQEAGRAGRDRKRAYAVVLCGQGDIEDLQRRFKNEYPEKDFIRRVYEALGNYYQIAAGDGQDTTHNFQLMDFCSKFHLSSNQTHYALKILELCGYIKYVEEVDIASRLHFDCTREELYNYFSKDKKLDAILNTILRSYTGLFSDYAFIDENEIASHAQVSQKEVYDTLIRLSKYDLLHYVPQRKDPMIIYTRPRTEKHYLSIPRSAYEDRKERAGKRLAKVVEYLSERTCCRSRILLTYFGEESTKDCGHCDICIAHRQNDSELTDNEFEQIRLELIKATEKRKVELTELLPNIPFPEKKVHKVCQYLLQHDPHFSIEEGLYLCYTP